MFTIDLLKGKGIPIKSKPQGIAIIAVGVAVPIIILITMFSFYMKNRIVISIQKQGIINYKNKISTLADVVQLQRAYENQKEIITNSLSEVQTVIGGYAQWSPILVEMVRNMPDVVVLTKLEVKQRSVRKKVPHKDNPEKIIDVTVPVNELQMTVRANPGTNCDVAVRDFRDRLRLSSVLNPKIEDIRVSQGFDNLDGQKVVSYQIDCILKTQL